jgi:Protein of unknown function (DUF3417)
MRPVYSFHVAPALPASLDRLRELAWNVRWAWSHGTIELFRRLDSELWESSGHNPVRMLGSIDQARLKEASEDEAFLAHLDRAAQELDRYRVEATDATPTPAEAAECTLMDTNPITVRCPACCWCTNWLNCLRPVADVLAEATPAERLCMFRDLERAAKGFTEQVPFRIPEIESSTG